MMMYTVITPPPKPRKPSKPTANTKVPCPCVPPKLKKPTANTRVKAKSKPARPAIIQEPIQAPVKIAPSSLRKSSIQQKFEATFGVQADDTMILNMSEANLIGARPVVKAFANRSLIIWHAGSNMKELCSNKYAADSMRDALMLALMDYDVL